MNTNLLAYQDAFAEFNIENGKNNRISLIKIENLPNKFKERLKQDPKTHRDIKDIASAQINSKDLSEFYDDLSCAKAIKHIYSIGRLQFNPKDKLQDITENDSLFQWDHKYLVVFTKLLSENILPTPEQFWKKWYSMNQQAMDYNLSSSETGYYNEPNKLSALKTMQIQYGSSDIEPFRSQIIKGAKMRAERNCAAFLRELHALLKISQQVKVFNHCIFDCICKSDLIAINDKGESVSVALCLNSRQSNIYARKKSNKTPEYFKEIVSRGIGLPIAEKTTQGVFLASDDEINDACLAINGDEQAILKMNQDYTW